MKPITMEDLVTVHALAELHADMADGEPELAEDAAAFARVRDGLAAVLAAENTEAVKHLLDMLADAKREAPVTDDGDYQAPSLAEAFPDPTPRCVSCGNPIDVEFGDYCPDCYKLRESSRAD